MFYKKNNEKNRRGAGYDAIIFKSDPVDTETSQWIKPTSVLEHGYYINGKRVCK